MTTTDDLKASAEARKGGTQLTHLYARWKEDLYFVQKGDRTAALHYLPVPFDASTGGSRERQHLQRITASLD